MELFTCFKKAGLKVKLSKCQFFKTQLHYLGHKISADGLESLSEKLEAIKNLAPTKNIDKVCHILQTTGILQVIHSSFCRHLSSNN